VSDTSFCFLTPNTIDNKGAQAVFFGKNFNDDRCVTILDII
jgi:hypothetical protein